MKQLQFLICVLFFTVGFSQKSMPNLVLNTLEGRPINLMDEISKDQLTIVSFWATWCVPCINELDAISEVYDLWQESENIELVAISTDDARTQKRIRPMVSGKGWPFKILLDKNQELKRALNIAAIPQTYVVRGSKIIHIRSGYSPGVEDQLYQIIQASNR